MTDPQSPDPQSHDTTRSIHLDVEVPGSPEEVWTAIATGPGVSSWYVPHEIEQREGGEVTLSFGPGMDVTGRVLAWEPPHRIVLGTDGPGLAFEFLVEARDGGSCIVRLVNSGFGTGADWDDQYDGMAEGWQIFLANLRLHLTHFAGRAASPMLPTATWTGPRDEAWQRLLTELGIPTDLALGDRIEVTAGDAPPLAGTVTTVVPHRISLVIDQPATGTAFIAAEGHRDQISMSIWSYLYGDDAPALAARDDSRWRTWLAKRGVEPGEHH
jgi:uncharacterized protein YndB with AHSA1/START domain